MHKVGFIFRKPRGNYHSIEKVFSIILSEKDDAVQKEVYYLPFTTKGIYSLVRNILYVTKCKANIIHVTGDVHYAVLGALGIKTVLTIHDLVFLHNSSGMKRKILKWLFLDLPLQRANVVTTISEATKKDILRHYKIDPKKIIVIPNPLDSNFKFSNKNFNELTPRILFIGTGKNKNLERSIEALKDIPCELRIIGKVKENQQIILNKSGVKYSNAYNISDEQIVLEYQKADIVLFPSTFEGFGLPILEGQQSGRVVITSNLEPMRSTSGQGARLVDPYSVESIREGILEVIQNGSLRNSLIEAGSRNIERFSAKEIVLMYNNLYQELMRN